jgi:membrane associated rhomboid family serine protease
MAIALPFGFGSSKLVKAWFWTTLVVSLIAAIDGGWLAGWLALVPGRVWRGEVWRLVTWIVVEPSAWQLVFTLLALYALGGELAVRWGDRRLRRYAIELLLAAAAITTLVALVVSSSAGYWHFGGWAVADVLVIGWARQFPDRSLNLYGLVSLNGRQLVMVTIGITIVYALISGPLHMAPEVLASIGAAMYSPARLRR